MLAGGLAGVTSVAGGELAKKAIPSHPIAASLVGGALGAAGGAGLANMAMEPSIGAVTEATESGVEAAAGKAGVEAGETAAVSEAVANPMAAEEVKNLDASLLGPVDAVRLHLYATNAVKGYIQTAIQALRNPTDLALKDEAKGLLDELTTTVADRYNVMADQDHGNIDALLDAANSPTTR